MHTRWNSSQLKPAYCTVFGRIAFIDLELGQQMIRFINVHLPHSEFAQVEFDATLEYVQSVIEEGWKFKRLNICGLDANAVLGAQLEDDIGDIIGRHNYGERNDRGFEFAAWLL